MRLRVVAIGQRMPAWVDDGWKTYADRMPRSLPLEIRQIPALRRGRNYDAKVARERESESLLGAAASAGRIVALDESGEPWTTAGLADRLAGWMQHGGDVNFLIGGPDGLSRECVRNAEHVWSLGPLTLPHPMVRLLLAEQLYRAWTILQNHPYHRA